MSLFSTEPALIVAVINAALILAVSFGVPISAEQKAAIDGVLGAVLAILAGLVIRSQVTPVAKVAPVATPAPVASGPADIGKEIADLKKQRDLLVAQLDDISHIAGSVDAPPPGAPHPVDLPPAA